MAHIPGLRSPYAKVGRLVYFGRMLDKIRLHAAGQLPAYYVANLGVRFDELTTRTLSGGLDDAQLLAWCHERGGPRTDEECYTWNCFLMKRGWRDDAQARLRQRIAESGFESKPILTFFDYIDFDEGRDPVAARAWES